MIISGRKKSQISDEQNKLIDMLQAEARTLFYDKMMYEINDSLTSILAICDAESTNSIPKIKEHINKINESLKKTKSYQSSTCGTNEFDIALALKNLLRVVRENYKDLSLISFISDIKAPAREDQSSFEKIFLHLFSSLFISGDSEVMIELRQKDQDAMITISKKDCTFKRGIIEKINHYKNEKDFQGSIHISTEGNEVEVIMRLPLQFKVISVSKPVVNRSTLPALKQSFSGEAAENKGSESKWGFLENQLSPDFSY